MSIYAGSCVEIDNIMEDSKRICKMDAILFAIVLETMLQQLNIWEGSSKLRSLSWTSLNQSEVLLRDKLVRDREALKDVIRRTLIILAENGEFSSLYNAVSALENRGLVATAKKIHHMELKSSFKKILEKLDEKREQWTAGLRNADKKVATFRDRIQDSSLNNATRLYFADMWLSARIEEVELKYSKPQPPLPRADLESCVHQELCRAYELQIQERETAVETWRLRYAEDTATMDERIAAKRDELRDICALRTERQALFDLHEGEMNTWLTFKRLRAERIEREIRNQTCATRIQAWWRGNMVRHALGPFRYLKNIKKTPSKSKKK